MADETRELANFADSLVFENIPAHIRGIAVDVLVDQIGCQIGCSDLPWTGQVRHTYASTGGTPEATVTRYGDRLPVVSAAIINSTFGHAFEFDDTNPFFHGHPGAELVAPLLAIGEREHVSGRDFLAAFIAGYEVRGRIGWSVSPDLVQRGGPHPITACGVFGVAAGVGKLLGLGSVGLENAIAIAGAHSGGLMQVTQTGGSVKRLYAAITASNGMQAAQLAQAGITGPEQILEGNRGLLRVYSSNYRPDRIIADFGNMWTIEHARFKLYSCCAGIHPAIDALTKILATHKLSAADIDSIEVSYPKGFYSSVSVASPHDLLGMQFSTSYSLALTALKGRNTSREYILEALTDPDVRSLAAKINVKEEPELTKQFEGRLAVLVKLQSKSHANHEELMMATKVRLASEQIDDKLRSQVADVLRANRCESLLQALRKIETLDDVATLFPMLVSKS